MKLNTIINNRYNKYELIIIYNITDIFIIVMNNPK